MSENIQVSFYQTLNLRVKLPGEEEQSYHATGHGSTDGTPDLETICKLMHDFAMANIHSTINGMGQYLMDNGYILDSDQVKGEEMLQEINQENWKEWIEPAQAVLDKLHSMYQDSIEKEDTGLME